MRHGNDKTDAKQKKRPGYGAPCGECGNVYMCVIYFTTLSVFIPAFTWRA
jgi:hypothetical protein